MKMKKIKNKECRYDMIGVTSDLNNPAIIVGVILQDKDANVKFTASVIEAMSLVKQGELDLPKYEEVATV